MKKYDLYTTIPYAFQFPFDVPQGTEVVIRGATRTCEYAYKLKLKSGGGGRTVATLTEPAGDIFELLVDTPRNSIGLITPLLMSREDAQDFTASLMLVVSELCDRMRPKGMRLSEQDRLARDRPLFDLIESTRQRWDREHAARVKQMGRLNRDQRDALH